MKISLEWLSDFIPNTPTAEQAADALTNGGLPVEVIERHGEDTVIDVEVTSNRGDCLSHLGVAREVAALTNRPLSDLAGALGRSAGKDSAAAPADVRIEALELCPHYTARLIRNVKVGPSPAWLVRRLEAVGLRPISNIVDVTNYVMFEMGQPLHAFDYDKLDGGRIIVRTAKGGETIASIDGKKRELRPSMLVIADASRPVAVAGVMGGLDSEVSGGTVNVLLESARFDPLSVRQTSRSLILKSDSSYRFERRIDPTLPERASLRAAQLIVQTAGGEIVPGLAVAGASGFAQRTLVLRLARLRQVLGAEIPTPAAVDALARLGLCPVLKDDRIECQVPSQRLDLNIEVDLIEEVARVFGYNQIPIRDTISIRVTPPEPENITLGQIGQILVGAGYFEAINVTFVSDNLRRDFVPPEASTLLRADALVRTDNAYLRPSLLPGLLEAVRRNESVGTLSAKLFEFGSAFWAGADNATVERRRLAFVGGEDLREVRGVVETLLGRLNPDRALVIVPDARPGFAGGAAGRIEWGGKTVGYLGKIDRAIAGKLSLRQLPAAAELELVPLLEGVQTVPQLHPLPRFPAIRRDLSIVVSEQVAFDQIAQTIGALALPSLEDMEYVTTYRGKPLEESAKSVTITLVFRSPTATLTSEQVEESVQRAIGAVGEKLGATLRT